jgi:ankyrin repeat protein
LNFKTEQCGYTPLIIAIMSGYIEIVNTLLDNEADPNIKDKLGYNPLWYCFNRILEEDKHYFENKTLCFKMASMLL